MKDLQLASATVGASLAPAVNEVFSALDTATVSQSLPPEVYNAVKLGLVKAFADTGYKINGTKDEITQQTDYMINEVRKDITKLYPAIRLGEIQVAFKRGVRKEYGEYMGLSVVSFLGFIAGYIKDETRKQALIEKNKLKEEPAYIPTFDQVYDIAKSNALNALKDVENGKDITFSGNVVYDFLEGIGLIDLDREAIIEIRKEARQLIFASFENKVELDRFKRIDNALIIEALLDPTKPQDKVKHLIRSRAKCMALKTFLQGVLLEGTDLAEMIESKRSAASNQGDTLATDR